MRAGPVSVLLRIELQGKLTLGDSAFPRVGWMNELQFPDLWRWGNNNHLLCPPLKTVIKIQWENICERSIDVSMNAMNILIMALINILTMVVLMLRWHSTCSEPVFLQGGLGGVILTCEAEWANSYISPVLLTVFPNSSLSPCASYLEYPRISLCHSLWAPPVLLPLPVPMPSLGQSC